MQECWEISWAYMKTKRKLIQIWLLCAAMLPAVVQAQFTFTTNNGSLTLTGYTGSDRAVTIPAITNGLSVVSIGNCAFSSNSNLVSLTIPASITNFALPAFCSCSNLTAAFFEGNAPRDGWPSGPSVFWLDGKPSVYYLPPVNRQFPFKDETDPAKS